MNTKLLCTLVGLLFTSTALTAQTSVWKVTKDRKTIYLGGTCQVLRSTDYPLPKEFDLAFAAAPQIYFETDLLRLQSPEAQQTITNRALSTDGRTLDKTLSPENWKTIQDFCGIAGIPEDNMNKVRSWRCRAMLTSLEMQKLGVSPKAMETYFFQRTLGTPKIVSGLDTVEQHIDFMTNQGTGRESEMIAYSLKEIAGLSTKHEALIKAWKEGNLTKLDELLLKSLRQDHPALYKDLITQRSAIWLPKIAALFQTPKSKFVLVGIGNLAGPDGLIAQLQKNGYQIEQLKPIDKS